ncbi:GyrI-like domain-containing protein [Qipengyuania sp. 6B39]|uniref:GyrI-like domain-containing protein n=1 Tax=Qipengyuania proteolytica TaxID=2867239 RepID=UPI001C897E3C|nr:GyrI-like domain-containing protein [Qipengyuania proteolytica]MBX7494301.1 GyrI-like domain-containing protein [Qipengyuania proteolytica]
MKFEPAWEALGEKRYIGVRRVVSMDQLPAVISRAADAAAELLRSTGRESRGGLLVRYLTIDMPSRIKIDVGFCVEEPINLDENGIFGTLPAGCYGTLKYVDASDGVAANARLIDWIGSTGAAMRVRRSEDGDVFDGRFELYSEPTIEGSVTLVKAGILVEGTCFNDTKPSARVDPK